MSNQGQGQIKVTSMETYFYGGVFLYLTQMRSCLRYILVECGPADGEGVGVRL